MNNPICNTVFDTRDLIEYIEELDAELLTLWKEYCEENHQDEIECGMIDVGEIDFSFGDFELYYDDVINKAKSIKEFAEDLECLTDYPYGETIIHEDFINEYFEELCVDIGDLSEMAHYIVVDWDATASNLLVDYTSFEYNGETYYARG